MDAEHGNSELAVQTVIARSPSAEGLIPRVRHARLRRAHDDNSLLEFAHTRPIKLSLDFPILDEGKDSLSLQ